MKTLSATLAASLIATAAYAQEAGFAPVTFDLPHHGKSAQGAVFYPSDGSGTRRRIAENGVFEGVDVMADSDIAEGRHPVVLMSHGMGGGVRPMTWLGAGLAARGAIVIALNHPNTSWGDFDLAKGAQHWTRAQDLSHALDVVLADPRWSDSIDTSRVIAAGFSYGGWTALSLGGARGNHAGIVGACETWGAQLVFCDEMLSEAVNVQAFDPEVWNASYRDPRVRDVVAIDPGLVWGIEAADLEALVDGASLIALGDEQTQMLATDVHKSGFAAQAPTAEVTVLAPAMHFSAMPLCKPAGAAILKAENDDPVCTDPEGTDRSAIHAAVIETIVSKMKQK